MRLVADADVLLPAVTGGCAALALRHEKVQRVLTPASACDEAFEYLPSVVERSEYQQKLPTAIRDIGRRDPDDVDVLALALHLNVAVWSNDNDFEDTGVEWHTTAELLKTIGVEST